MHKCVWAFRGFLILKKINLSIKKKKREGGLDETKHSRRAELSSVTGFTWHTGDCRRCLGEQFWRVHGVLSSSTGTAPTNSIDLQFVWLLFPLIHCFQQCLLLCPFLIQTSWYFRSFWAGAVGMSILCCSRCRWAGDGSEGSVIKP